MRDEISYRASDKEEKGNLTHVPGIKENEPLDNEVPYSTLQSTVELLQNPG